MNFSKIDDILYEWADENNLPIQKEYKESEVRSIEITDKAGHRFQLWIDFDDRNECVTLNAWDFKKKRYKVNTSPVFLHEKLNDALRTIRMWADAL